MKRLLSLVVAAALAGAAVAAAPERAVEIARAEYAKYCRAITGKEPPAATFSVDASLDATFDEYRVASDGDGVAFRGANGRAVLYAVYDFLARRGGCRWFWDGDVVPRKARIDCAGLDVREKSQFAYRGIRYFAHRGLTRFQAEHWGFEDWKREIDWCLKRRLNLMMLRIGMDDVFQKAFPGVVDYPDPAKPIPEAMPGYDNRSLFWSLQYRGALRKRVMDYAFARGMMQPEDFGTMSHWYSRTPQQFLDKMKPPFIPQQGGSYGKPTDRVWDVRDPKWLQCYWKLTETSLAAYGKPDLLHTIGLGERRCSTNRAENTRMKIDVLDLNLKNAVAHYPESKILLAGWDFYQEWRPEEVRALLPTLDASRMILWDYAADATRDYRKDMKGLVNNFTQWNVVGKFPYTFGIFLAFESALDIRANYDVIAARQRHVENDPFCRGYIFWPESSHTDTLLLRYFTQNAWCARPTDVGALVHEFCLDRYGAQAESFERVWRQVVPLSALREWGGNYGSEACGLGTAAAPKQSDAEARLAPAREIFDALANLRWEGDFARRDAVDLARTVADRLAQRARRRLFFHWNRWRAKEGTAEEVTRAAARYARLGELLADVLALHTDYSIYESFLRLDAIEKIRNPDFEHVLVDNASCGYCRSHQYECARYWYQPAMRDLTDGITAKVAANDRTQLDAKKVFRRDYHAELLARPLAEMRPALPRTPESWRRVMLALAAAAEM